MPSFPVPLVPHPRGCAQKHLHNTRQHQSIFWLDKKINVVILHAKVNDFKGEKRFCPFQGGQDQVFVLVLFYVRREPVRGRLHQVRGVLF
jgi:hypothetical protein